MNRASEPPQSKRKPPLWNHAGSIVTSPAQIGSSLKVSKTNLVAHASDTDLETITLAGVGTDGVNLLTTNGVTLTTDANWIFYTNSVTVKLEAKADAAVIRYTLDGSEPTERSTAYSAPITIKETTRVRATCFQPEVAPSLTV